MSKCTTKCLDLFDSANMWGVFDANTDGARPSALVLDEGRARSHRDSLTGGEYCVLPVVVVGTVHNCTEGRKTHLDIDVNSGTLVDMTKWARRLP